jgi:hypothetical protein
VTDNNRGTRLVTFEVGSCTDPSCPVRVEPDAYTYRYVTAPEVRPGLVQGHGVTCSGCGNRLISRVSPDPRHTPAPAGDARGKKAGQVMTVDEVAADPALAFLDLAGDVWVRVGDGTQLVCVRWWTRRTASWGSWRWRTRVRVTRACSTPETCCAGGAR